MRNFARKHVKLLRLVHATDILISLSLRSETHTYINLGCFQLTVTVVTLGAIFWHDD